MGRGRMGSSGGSSRGRMGSSGSSRGSIGSRRGSIGGGIRRSTSVHRHTTVVVHGGGHHGHYHGRSSVFSNWVLCVIGIPFIFVGLSILIGGLVGCFGSFKYSAVSAEAIGNEKVGMYYYTTYDYTVNGKDYINRSMQSWEIEETVGNVVTIYYLKSDPNKIYEEKPNSLSEGILLIFGGLACGGMGAVPLVFGIKALKSSKNGDSSDLDSKEAETSRETQNRCAYCGAKYNKTSESCPKCGASRTE